MITFKNPVIRRRTNLFSEERDYMLVLSKEQYDAFRSFDFNAKKVLYTITGDFIYWIRIIPHSFKNNDEEYVHNKMKEFLDAGIDEMDINFHVLPLPDSSIVRCVVDVDDGIRKKVAEENNDREN